MQSKSDSHSGRHKRAANEVSRLPLFMSAGRSRVSENVAMSAATAREKQRYLRWASEAARVSREEAEVMMLDRALGDFMKRDEAWQIEKAAVGNIGSMEVGDEVVAHSSRPPLAAEGGTKAANAVTPGALK
jgi:hypothetical protein